MAAVVSCGANDVICSAVVSVLVVVKTMLVCIVVNVTGSNPVDAAVDCEVICSDVVISAAVEDGVSVVVSILVNDAVVCCVCVVVVAIDDVVTQSMFAITESVESYLTFGCVASVEAEK